MYIQLKTITRLGSPSREGRRKLQAAVSGQVCPNNYVSMGIPSNHRLSSVSHNFSRERRWTTMVFWRPSALEATKTVQADLPDSATPTAPHPPTLSLPSSPSPAHALPAHGPGRVCYFSTRTKWHLVYHTDRCCSGLRLYGNKQIFVDMTRPEGLDPCSRCVPMQHCREPDVSVENASAAVAEAARGAEAVHTCTPAFTRAVHTSSGGAEAVQSMYEA